MPESASFGHRICVDEPDGTNTFEAGSRREVFSSTSHSRSKTVRGNLSSEKHKLKRYFCRKQTNKWKQTDVKMDNTPDDLQFNRWPLNGARSSNGACSRMIPLDKTMSLELRPAPRPLWRQYEVTGSHLLDRHQLLELQAFLLLWENLLQLCAVRVDRHQRRLWEFR